MAEGLFREAVKARGDVTVSSAGVGTIHGQPPSLHAVEVLRPLGIDITRIRSQPLSEELVENATHIFAMTRGHLETIQNVFPEAADKAFLVCEFDDELRAFPDVPDPIGLGLDAYVRCRDTIKKALPSILKFIDQSDMTTTQASAASSYPASSPTRPLHIAIASDHAGLELKQAVFSYLSKRGENVGDLGTASKESVDYNDFAEAVCQEVIAGRADFGVLMCGSGVGMSIMANRHPQIRAALVSNPADAAVTRQHNDANVLCLGARSVNPTDVARIVEAFLTAKFEGGRHEQRVNKLSCGISASPGRAALAEVDPEIFAAIEEEAKRQFENIELIASENFTSPAVMEAQGSCLTNKYAEGYPGRRWYGGCEHVDVVEQLAIDRAKELFGGDHANVQPHSGSPGEHRRLFLRAPAGRQNPHDGSRARRPPHARPQGELLRPLLRALALRRQPDRRAHRLRGARKTRRRLQAEDDHRRRVRLSAAHRFREECAPSRTAWARCFSSIWRTSPASSRQACIRRPCRSRIS